MGAGISTERWKRMQYRRLKNVQRRMEREGIRLRYHNLELKGPHCRVYFAGAGPASNGERLAWLVLRYNPANEPDSARKSPGDVDYTDFHTRKNPGDTFDAGVRKLKGSS